MNTLPIYTPEIILDMTSRYTANPVPETVSELALEIGMSERSIIAKLSSLGIYKKKVYLTKQGTPPIRKEVYIQRIADSLDIDIMLLECMEKCTKQALTLIDKKINELKPIVVTKID